MKNILAQLKNNPVVTKLGLAGAISMVSLLASWSAIVVLLQGNLPWAITLAIIAFLLDSLDGFTARKLGKASEFGRQLDGMIDAFNYSLFAALLVQQVLLPGVLGYITGFAILAFGILRLIGFNTEGYLKHKGKLYYRGVVTCHLSLAAIMCVFISQFIALSPWVYAAVLCTLAVLQLSSVRTRKTGALAFWIPISVLLVIGAWAWL